MLIFKRKTIPKINNKHGVVVSAQEKGWMDSEQMKVWIEKVWRARIGGLGRRKSLFVYDSFEAHVRDTVKAPFKHENTELAVIHGGLFFLLQLLDVSLNKPFKDGVQKQWMADGIHEFTVRRFCNSIINDGCLFSEVWHHKQFGSDGELVYNSTENTHELDDSSIENLFESDPESEFEGFIV